MLQPGKDYDVDYVSERDSYFIRLHHTAQPVTYTAGISDAPQPRPAEKPLLLDSGKEAIDKALRQIGALNLADEVLKSAADGTLTLDSLQKAFLRANSYSVAGNVRGFDLDTDSVMPYRAFVNGNHEFKAQCTGCNGLGAALSKPVLQAIDPGIEVEVRGGVSVLPNGKSSELEHGRTYYYKDGSLLAVKDFTATRVLLSDWLKALVGLSPKIEPTPIEEFREQARQDPGYISELETEKLRSVASHLFDEWVRSNGKKIAQEIQSNRIDAFVESLKNGQSGKRFAHYGSPSQVRLGEHFSPMLARVKPVVRSASSLVEKMGECSAIFQALNRLQK